MKIKIKLRINLYCVRCVNNNYESFFIYAKLLILLLITKLTLITIFIKNNFIPFKSFFV